MTKQIIAHRSSESLESEMSLAQLRGDCARMAPHWVVPAADVPAPVPFSSIHGVVVPPASAKLVGAMSVYSD